jgi:hypothetical protein
VTLLCSVLESSLEGVHIDSYSFGVIQIDGITYDYDVLIDRGSISKRRKKKSKRFRSAYGHTPLSAEEAIPWACRRLVVGTGATGALPIMDEVRNEESGAVWSLSSSPQRRRSNCFEHPPRRPTRSFT